jgi:hypothetical protein
MSATDTILSIILSMAVTKKDGNKRVPVGEVDVWVPTLAAFGVIADIKETDEEGLPVYTTNEANWLQNSIKNAVLANARNKLTPQTVDPRPGATMPSDLATLCEPSLGGGNPEILRQIAAVKALFREYVSGLGKSAKVNALLTEAFGSVKALGMQPISVRERIATYVETFVEWVDAEGRELDTSGIAYVEKVLAACADEEDFDVDDL